MRLVARLSTWRPTVRPICASSPATCTAVVTTSVVLGRPSRGGSAVGRGGGGVAGRVAAAGFAVVACVVGAAPAFTLGVAARVFAAAFAGFVFADEDFVADDFVVLVFVADDFVLVFVADDFVALAARRSPPIRDGRLDRRLPRTLGSALAFAVFFVFFFADFSAMRKKVARALVSTGYSHAATRTVTALIRKK